MSRTMKPSRFHLPADLERQHAKRDANEYSGSRENSDSCSTCQPNTFHERNEADDVRSLCHQSNRQKQSHSVLVGFGRKLRVLTTGMPGLQVDKRAIQGGMYRERENSLHIVSLHQPWHFQVPGMREPLDRGATTLLTDRSGLRMR